MKIFDYFKKCASPIEASSACPDQPETTASAAEQPAAEEETVRVHNLLILDESGSMQAIYNPALTGVNETLQTIRQAQAEHPRQEHFVTFVSFSTSHYKKLYHNTPADKTTDITSEQYSPSGGTPLFDTMGRAIEELRPMVKKNDVVLVTIITDGYENASREYNGPAIRELVKTLRKEGWVFTYIGANQDVEAVAESIAINNRMAFSADERSTREMFRKEKEARLQFACRVDMSRAKKDLEDNYFE